MLRGAGAAEAHSALQRDYLCFGSGPDPEGAGLALRRGEPALQHQAPLPGHQFGAFERFVRLSSDPKGSKSWKKKAIVSFPRGRQMLQKNGQHSVPRQPPSEGFPG